MTYPIAKPIQNNQTGFRVAFNPAHVVVCTSHVSGVPQDVSYAAEVAYTDANDRRGILLNSLHQDWKYLRAAQHAPQYRMVSFRELDEKHRVIPNPYQGQQL